MKRLALALGLLAFVVPSAQASEHNMKVNELLLSADGSNDIRFVELLDEFDEPFAGPSYRLRSYDAAGVLFDSKTLNDPFSSRDNTKPYLISTAAADAKYHVTGDQVWSLTLPPGDAAQVCFENASSNTIIHCLSYGSITTPVVAESGNQHAAKPADGNSLQRCSSGYVAAAPTPRAANACGSGGPGGGGGGTDKRKPKTTLGGKKVQDVDKLAVTVKLDENGSVTASGTVRVPNSSKVYRFKKVKKSAKAGKKVKLRLRLSKKSKRAVKHALGAGRKLKAKIKVVGSDKAGNKTTKRKTVRLTD